jgi:L-rhamnose mutarotase
MYAGKKSSLLQWEKVLAVMLNGQPVNEDILSKMKEMDGVPMYRLSSFIYHVKLAGGVVKVIKNGRKIESYQLVNIKDMEKYLADREKVFAKSTKAVKTKKQSVAKTPKTPKVKKVVAPVQTKTPKLPKVSKLADLELNELEVAEVDSFDITELTGTDI